MIISRDKEKENDIVKKEKKPHTLEYHTITPFQAIILL